MNKLTEMQCRNAQPSQKVIKLFDGWGLYLEITPQGRKYWRLKYRSPDGKEKRASFGPYPIISLKEAREKRDEARKLLLEHKDPVREKRRKKELAIAEMGNTFEKVAREWHNHHVSEWKEDHAKTIMSRLERDVFPIIGNQPIRELTHKNLLDMAKSIQARGANELAKRVIQMSRHIFQYAIITGRTDRNLAEDLRGLIKAKPKKHFASLDMKELPEFLGVLYANEARLMPLTHLAVQFLMLTFVRTGEMIKAEWDEFDLEAKTWLIPARRMKMKKDHLVPLSEQALEVLRQVRDLHTNQKYVFPSRARPRNHMSNNTVLMALRRMGYAGEMTGHGFRSLAMSAIMEKLHYRFEVPDAQLAHAKRHSLGDAYDRAKFIPERIKMMQDWADYLDSVRGIK